MTPKTPERPRLGDFTRPASTHQSTPKPRTSSETAPVKKNEVSEVSEVSDVPLQQGLEKELRAITPPATEEEKEAQGRVELYESMQDSMSVVADYKEYLKQQKISEEEAARIVDDMLTRGFYEETFQLSKTRSCTLRTREHRDTIRLQTAMQVQRPLFQDSLNELQARYNMAASLSAYNGETYYFPEFNDSAEKVDSLFDERLRAVERMPSPIFSLVSLHLSLLDQKIMAVLRPGVAENF